MVNDFPVPSLDVTYQTLPGRGIILLFPARESLVVTSRSRLGTGKSLTCFYSVNIYLVMVMSGQQSSWLRRMRLAGRSSVIITVRNSIANVPRGSTKYVYNIYKEYHSACMQWWAKLLRLVTVNSLSYFVKIKY
jgi:hypothetical protein